jgi:hypothetical protein
MKSNTQKKLLYFLLIVPVLLLAVGLLYFIEFQQYDDLTTDIIILVVIGIVIVLYLFLSKKMLTIIEKGNSPSWKHGTVHALLTVISLCAIIYGATMSYYPLASKHYNTGPILTWGSNQDPATEIYVMWRTNKPGASIVYYGTAENNLNLQATVQENTEWHRVSLTGLLANTQYYYRVEGQKKIYNFFTSPPANASFTFLLFSDVRQNSGLSATITQPDVPQFMMDTMESQGLRQAFTLVCGDITRHALDNETWKSWFDDLTSSGLATGAVVQDTPGNHERGQNKTGEIFGSLYPYINRPNYYNSFNYSSVHILTLDPFNYTTGSWGNFSSEQLLWAEKDLQNAVSMPYRIITMHPPPIENNVVVETYRPLVELCDKYGVDAVFFGHVHDFAYSFLNHTYYFLIGVGGNTAYKPCGFTQVDITPKQMTISMQWMNGTTQLLAKIDA